MIFVRFRILNNVLDLAYVFQFHIKIYEDFI